MTFADKSKARHTAEMPNRTEALREQLREAKLGYQRLAGEVHRLSWELSEAQERVQTLEQQLADKETT